MHIWFNMRRDSQICYNEEVILCCWVNWYVYPSTPSPITWQHDLQTKKSKAIHNQFQRVRINPLKVSNCDQFLQVLIFLFNFLFSEWILEYLGKCLEKAWKVTLPKNGHSVWYMSKNELSLFGIEECRPLQLKCFVCLHIPRKCERGSNTTMWTWYPWTVWWIHVRITFQTIFCQWWQQIRSL